MFIKRLEETSDLAKVTQELNSILATVGWGQLNQIGLKHRPGAEDPWFDAAGSLYDKEKKNRLSLETDYSEWSVGPDSYIRQQIEMLENNHNFKCGRVRIMRLLPRSGLSVHRDEEIRYHLVLKTNHKSYIAHHVVDNNPDRSVLPSTAVCYHLPMDSTWYEVDTREVHWVYNGGDVERIHLVVCGDH
jgi:hypothetical protein